ncbi:MAG: DegV family protein [Chloroflexaceae bacterium]|nr:DegV family protein [Chloroflexaceae bacterium]
MIAIVTDSTADIPDDLRELHAIHVVPLRVQFGEQTFCDGVDLSKDEFYTRLLSSDVLPTTSTPPVGAFLEQYRSLLDHTDTILSLHISGKLSSTVRTARQAAEMVMQERPNTHIEVIDTGWAQMVVAYMTVQASIAAHAGATLPELSVLIDDLKARAFIYIGFDTLKFLERGGRIGRARSLLGTLLRVKPIVAMRDGEVVPLEQVRTHRRLISRMGELVQEQGPLDELAIEYSNDPEPAHAVREQLLTTEILPAEQIRIVQTGSVVGTHIGPNGIGVLGLRRATE